MTEPAIPVLRRMLVAGAARHLSEAFALNRPAFTEGSMRAYLVLGAVVGVLHAAQVGTLRGDPGKDTQAERIARLIQQLGDDDFDTREAATRALGAIGVPALAALRKATSSPDLEVRRRATRISQAITEAAARAELARLQGTWAVASYEIEGKRLPGKDRRSTMTITGDKWVAKWARDDGGVQVESGILKIANPEKGSFAVDFVHLDGPHKGSTVFAIARVDRDTFKFCYHVRAEARPTGFVTKAGDTSCGLVTLNDQKK
jgi:uncharacterized protein (TIGR03067 family)